MEVIFDKNRQKVPIKSWCGKAEQGAMEQALNVSNHPAVFHHVALMPDLHQGYGMPIGGVAALKNAISPNMVGVDIACGIMAGRFDIAAEILERDDKVRIMREIRKLIPMGMRHQKDISVFGKKAKELLENHRSHLAELKKGKELVTFESVAGQLGTLGGGNHFIELQSDETGILWLMIHSGSRNIGKCVCDLFNRTAKELNEKYNIKLPSRDLSYLPSDSAEARDYLALMDFCMDFSFVNRECMLEMACRVLSEIPGKPPELTETINIHHNYASLEKHYGEKVWIHRKGAISAVEGGVGLIPGSMGTVSFIVKGKGNPESFASSSHGAGRIMGRHAAKKSLTMEKFREQMDGVVFHCSENSLDESPMAYKDIWGVIEEQKDLVEITHTLKPIAVEKG